MKVTPYTATTLDEALIATADAVAVAVEYLLPVAEGAERRVLEAMRYAMTGGKRFRPFLALQSGRLFDVNEEQMLRVAVAIECIHAYSLVNDDLPAMDNDTLRRGQPTTHVQFDEATAILAGDGLQALAFEILADSETHSDPYIRCELCLKLARSAGCHGMVGGQMIDLACEKTEPDIGTVTRLHQMKTGAMIACACEAGAIMGRASREATHALGAFAHDLGLAFQVVDDLLDVEGDPQVMGKSAGKDVDSGKATFVSILGLDRAREQAELLASQARSHLDLFGEKADLLRQVTFFVLNRHK